MAGSFEMDSWWFRLILEGQAATIIATTGTFAIAGYCVYKLLNDKGLRDCIVHAITNGSVEIDIIAINESGANLAQKILSSEDLLEWFNDALNEYSQLHNHVIGMFNDVKLVPKDVRKISQDELLDIKKDAAALKKKNDDWLGEPLKKYIAGEFRSIVDAFANIGNRNRKMEEGKKMIFNDPVHGTIALGEKLVEVVNTPQFQRLRNVCQLGACYFVYPGASHNRFEHCIGTCHLAGKLIRHLRDQQPELKITDDEILCVELAGLCHDLGHGPYSHMFDNKFLPKMGQNIKHEEVSCKMFEYLLEKNGIKLCDNSTKERDMIEMVKRMIEPPENLKDSEEVKPDRIFLYEIISNSRNKVDVDKWDYFARDCHHLGMPNSFDHKRFMKHCRVLKLPENDGENGCPQGRKGTTTIGVHEKESKNLYEMFHLRASLHQRAYQHRVPTAIEAMICDAMLMANDSFEIVYESEDGKRFEKTRISKAVENMNAFEHLDDSVFYTMLRSEKVPAEARQLLKRILKRNLYQLVESVKYPLCDEKDKKQLKNVLKNECKEVKSEIFKGVDEQDILKELVDINVAMFDYGMKYENPCDNFYFYSKHEPEKPIKISKNDVSEMLPEKFGEYEIRVFSKCDLTTEDGKKVHEKIKIAVTAWQREELKRANPFNRRTEHAMKQIICDELDKQKIGNQRKRKIDKASVLEPTFKPGNKEVRVEMTFKVEDADVDAASRAFPKRK